MNEIENVARAFSSGLHELQDEDERRYDAFLLDPGMGPMYLLTSDRRVIEDMRAWDGNEVREAKPPHATMCSMCSGMRWQDSFVCWACHGRG